jgi:hypothetical protein
MLFAIMTTFTTSNASAENFLGHNVCNNIEIQILRTYENSLKSSIRASKLSSKNDIDIAIANIENSFKTMHPLVSLSDHLGCDMEQLRHRLEVLFTASRTNNTASNNRKKRPSELIFGERN